MVGVKQTDHPITGRDAVLVVSPSRVHRDCNLRCGICRIGNEVKRRVGRSAGLGTRRAAVLVCNVDEERRRGNHVLDSQVRPIGPPILFKVNRGRQHTHIECGGRHVLHQPTTWLRINAGRLQVLAGGGSGVGFAGRLILEPLERGAPGPNGPGSHFQGTVKLLGHARPDG